MREAEREALAQRVLGMAIVGTGDAAEVTVRSESSGLTRFTQNAIHQNVAQADTRVRVRAIVAERTGVATTNDLSEAGLRAVVVQARDTAEHAPHDGVRAPLAKNGRTPPPAGAYFERTAAAEPALRAGIAADIITSAESSGLWAAGYATTSTDGITIVNSTGTTSSFDGTACGLNVKTSGADASGFAEAYANDVAELDGAVCGRRAAHKALDGASPRAVEPGAWTVILEPPAAGELLAYLVDHFSAQAYDEGSSFLCDGLGRTYAGENVTIWDDYTHPLHAGIPFDYEGYAKQRVALFDAGIARNVVTDATWAKRLERPNTGHGAPAPSATGPEPAHVVVAGGSKTVEQFIAETQRGILVSRFWYIRPVDVRKTIVTGMTRDGTYFIENGAIRHGVRNLRFNQSILEALSHAEFAERQVRTGGYGYRMVLPAMKIEGFHFTSVTDF